VGTPRPPLFCNELCNPDGKTRVRCGTHAGHLRSLGGFVGRNQYLDQRFYLWGGLDSNQRPADYESYGLRVALSVQSRSGASPGAVRVVLFRPVPSPFGSTVGSTAKPITE
jgi:hypothetical protein